MSTSDDKTKYNEIMKNNESIEKEVSSQIFVDDGYFLFREWYKTSGSTAKIPQKKDFIKNINSKYGKANSKNYWRGIKFVKKKENDEEEDSHSV